MSISLIVAMDRNGIIAIDGKIPWHRPADLRNFVKLTRGHTVVMGRKTYESIGHALLDRTNVVLTSKKNGISKDKDGNYINYYNSSDDYLYSSYLTNSHKKIFIIGGMEIYKAFAPYVERMYITVINQYTERPEGVEWIYFPFPAFSSIKWTCIEQRMLENDFYYVFDRKG